MFVFAAVTSGVVFLLHKLCQSLGCSSESIYDPSFGRRGPWEECTAGGLEVGLLVGCHGRGSVSLNGFPASESTFLKKELHSEHYLWTTAISLGKTG